MKVSVVIPVYNAREYLGNAVASALAQPETHEIILAEDGSTDNSLEICHQLADSDARIRVIGHPEGSNRGAGATRNLGMAEARADYIAFLDADDNYLPGRFTETANAFARHNDADGVYEPVGTQYYDEDMRADHRSRETEHIGIHTEVTPAQLYRTLALGRYGFIHLDGLVLKRGAVQGKYRFDPTFIQCQDSDFVLRLSRELRLYPGRTRDVVALRGIHRANRIFDIDEAMHYRRRFLQKCIDQNFYGSRDTLANLYIISRRIGASRFYRPVRSPRIIGLPVKLLCVFGYLIMHPRITVRLLTPAFKG